MDRCAAIEEVFAVAVAVSSREATSMSFRSRRTDLPGVGREGGAAATILASLEAINSISSSTASQKLKRLRGNAESPADFARATGEVVSSTVVEIELSTWGAAENDGRRPGTNRGNAWCDYLS